MGVLELRILFLQSGDNLRQCQRYFPNITRLHPQGKGGPQVILCGRRLKSSQKSENVPTKQIKNRSFSKDRPFTSRGLLMQKSVFLTHHVVHSFRVNEKSERSLNFSSSRMPWLCHPKNMYGALLHSDKIPKIPPAPTDRLTYGPTFLSVAHTKCPSGNNFLKNNEFLSRKNQKKCSFLGDCRGEFLINPASG